MRKTKMMLLGVLLACTSGAWAATGDGIQKYELDGVTADFKQFHIGDTVPPLYLTPEYNIKQWQQRNLPAPDAGTRWTYMGGSYVLITETEGKSSKSTMAKFSIIAKNETPADKFCRWHIFIVAKALFVKAVLFVHKLLDGNIGSDLFVEH